MKFYVNLGVIFKFKIFEKKFLNFDEVRNILRSSCLKLVDDFFLELCLISSYQVYETVTNITITFEIFIDKI